MESEVLVGIITAITTVTSILLKPTADRLINRIFNKIKKDPIQESLQNNEKIINKLEKIKSTYDVDRIWMIQFHNGGHFYPTGKSVQKFSMFYENVSAGVSSQQNQFQNIPISLFNRSFSYLAENNYIAIKDFSDNENELYGLKAVAESTDCKSTYLFAMKSLDGKFIGEIGLDYVKSKKTLENKEIQSLLIEVAAIGTALMQTILNNKK